MSRPANDFRFDGVKLRTLRGALGQEPLARELGVTLRTVQRWEDGKEPRFNGLMALCERFGLEPADWYTSAREEREAA
jgi:transcriptional regulator with XRE-family HTH domain